MGSTLKISVQCILLAILNFFLICDGATTYYRNTPETELVLVYAIARHGQRTTYSFYPNDPHKNETFYPEGPGGLLNEGKYTGFRLGQRLREEYDSFLGPLYTDDLILARSTDIVRTRMTTEVILAGLFPPTEEQSWHPTLKWLPIPVYTKETKHEDVINPACPYRSKLMNDLPNLPGNKEKYITPYQELFDYVETHSGKPIKNLHHLIEFYFIITTEEEMGLELPEWTKKVYPKKIHDAVIKVYEYQNSNLILKQMHTGYLLKEIIETMTNKSENHLEPAERKIFLIGAHESTMGWFLEHLKVYENELPPYSSSIIVEGHKDKKNNFYIKIRYLDDLDGPIRNLKMPNCDMLCPLEKFKSLNKNVLPKISFEEICTHGGEGDDFKEGESKSAFSNGVTLNLDKFNMAIYLLLSLFANNFIYYFA